MKELVEGFPEQIKHAIELGEQIQVKHEGATIQNIVVAGLGGSGIGANLVQAILASKLKVPFSVYKTYDLPEFIDEHTLFIACSFSGNTEETLASLSKAEQKRAQIACITSGGKLLEIAETKGYSYAPIPGESKSPRANLGYSFIQLLYLLHKKGLVDKFFKDQIEAGHQLITDQKDQIRSVAQNMAQSLHNRMTVFYADAKFEPLAVRCQQQINENSKQFCHINVFPEMNHNELVGWMFPEQLYKQAQVILVRSSLNHQRVDLRMDLCAKIFEGKGANVTNFELKGESYIEQALYFINVTDWVSLYLAELNNIDPRPVEIIDYLKSELAKV